MLTQDYLKSILEYDSETGIFTRLVSLAQCTKIGEVAGTVAQSGYLRMKINYKLYLAHRLAWLYMYGELPENEIDHINHIKTGNRACNLREVTHEENGKNRSISRNNTSSVSRVYWHKGIGKWNARINVGRKRKSIGAFTDKFEAICARKSAENKFNYHENHGQVRPL